MCKHPCGCHCHALSLSRLPSQSGVQVMYGVDPSNTSATWMQALGDGLLAEDQLNAAVGRGMLTRFRLGEFDTGNGNSANPFAGPYDESQLDSAAHRALAREAAAKSTVLLRNVGGRLPLIASPASIAVIGPFADCSDRTPGYGGNQGYLHSYNGQPSSVNTIFAAIAAAYPASNVTLTQGTEQTTWVSPTGIADAVAAAQAADLTVLCLGLGARIEAEGLDRYNLSLPFVQAALLDAIAAVVPSSRIVLVLVSAGGIDLDYGAADAVLQAWYGGEEAGGGIADVMTGTVNPSGRLPLTFYTNAYLPTVNSIADFNLISGPNNTGRTYRYYTGPNIAYRFGYGLSYTTFNYSGLTAALSPDNTTVTVQATVSNTGSMAGREVVQLYVTVPPAAGVFTPAFNLQGFAVVQLDAAAAAAAAAETVKEPSPAQVEVSRVVRISSRGSSATVTFQLPVAAAFLTTFPDGSRNVTGGAYTIAVSGHLPNDPAGVSNTVQTDITLPPIANVSPPLPATLVAPAPPRSRRHPAT